MLNKILSYEVNDSYDGTLLATVSRVSAAVICVTYLLIYFAMVPEYGFIYDPKIFFSQFCECSDFFRSMPIISLICLVSIPAMISGFASILYGLKRIRNKEGIKIVLSGGFGVSVGLINLFILFKTVKPG